MQTPMKAPAHVGPELQNFWIQYFAEVPTCNHPGCEHVAAEVDPFFPYLDDLNRCFMHRSGHGVELSSVS